MVKGCRKFELVPDRRLHLLLATLLISGLGECMTGGKL